MMSRDKNSYLIGRTCRNRRKDSNRLVVSEGKRKHHKQTEGNFEEKRL